MIVNKIIKLETCKSTNSYALENFQKLEHGSVIITDNQTHGRGRRGNFWESEPFKNLTFSVKYDLNLSTSCLQKINSCVVKSILKISQRYIAKAYFKEPNDIYVEDKKICGILVENIVIKDKISSTIIGIGLNVNQQKFQNLKASSMRNFLQKEIDLYVLLAEILQELNKNIEKDLCLT